MEFLSDDFNIKNHVENIYKLINYLVNKINEKEKSDLKKKEKEDATNRYKIRFMLGE